MNASDQTRLTSPPASLDREAPWRWLAGAVGIMRRQLILSIGYGLLFVFIGYLIISLLSASALLTAVPVAVGGFALVGPLFAAGLYAIARADEEGRTARFREVLFPEAKSPGQIAYCGVLLLIATAVWALTATGLLIAFSDGQASTLASFSAFALSTGKGIAMVILGSVLGGIIGFCIFSVSAFSIPFLFDQNADFATAIRNSVGTVREETIPMVLWAWIIAVSIAIGGATLLLGFIVLFPLLGFATWIGYRERFGKKTIS